MAAFAAAPAYEVRHGKTGGDEARRALLLRAREARRGRARLRGVPRRPVPDRASTSTTARHKAIAEKCAQAVRQLGRPEGQARRRRREEVRGGPRDQGRGELDRRGRAHRPDLAGLLRASCSRAEIPKDVRDGPYAARPRGVLRRADRALPSRSRPSRSRPTARASRSRRDSAGSASGRSSASASSASSSPQSTPRPPSSAATPIRSLRSSRSSPPTKVD